MHKREKDRHDNRPWDINFHLGRNKQFIH